tara:strand:+ start:554 stop:676 length:123 start_codon:yes stop_codon:yes gene_type:complete
MFEYINMEDTNDMIDYLSTMDLQLDRDFTRDEIEDGSFFV